MLFRWLLLITLFISIVSGCGKTPVDFNSEVEVFKQFSELKDWMDARPSETLVINFWATSCPPCIKEMPHFREFEAETPDVKVLLVSLDDAEDLENRVYPFIEKYNITPEVVLLADEYYSAWTDEIDESWFGALPATLIVHGDHRKFKFGAYHSVDEILDDVNHVTTQ